MILSTLNDIPQELIVRSHPITIVIGIGLFLSFALVSIAKLVKSDIYSVLMISFVKNKGLYNYIRESFSLQKVGSILLILNYLISFGLLLILMFDFDVFSSKNHLFFVLLIPISFLAFHFFILYIVGWITGEIDLVRSPVIMKINGIQLLGLVCSILVFLWTLNFVDQKLLLKITILVFVLETAVRIFRSLVYVLSQGVSWYYIIVYLCTLEILPLFLIYYILIA